ncbi:MAG: aminomethyltransferase family protein [Pseudomonadota bacterium]
MSTLGIDLRIRHTPFHPRTREANLLNRWHSWQGFTVADAYFDADLEYFAVRNATGVFDLSPMTKYRISGPEALAYLDRLLTRDVTKLKPGRVAYAVWCDDAGKVIDDGTLFHLDDGTYRLCSQEYHLEWLQAAALGFDVLVQDETDSIAALAIQGPTSCAVLGAFGFANLPSLKPFGLRDDQVEGWNVTVSRTGFTGDLGYELWIDPEDALAIWDRLFDAGRPYGIKPMGGDALQMARIEAGFIQAGCDFLPADRLVRPGRARSPFELGLGWLVDFNKPHFSGRAALALENDVGSRWELVRLLVDGNKPARDAYLYGSARAPIGFVTSAMWSPVAKQNIALGTIERGKRRGSLKAEIFYQRELHWSRVLADCQTVEGPFFDPPRRRTTPALLR